MYFGSAWYPEHWPEERWSEDIRLMQQARMNVCRIAEFAWSSMEPSEGQYHLDWIKRAIDLLHSHGIAVVLGTPSAAPPAWLTSRYHDTLAYDQNGHPAQHGNRCHVSPVSETYKRFCRKIAEQMALTFGKDERVIGWQIDNEYSRVDYSEQARRHFQIYLKQVYGTLDALNAHWSTAYWSQTYSAWEQIPIPIGAHNPGLMLAFRHFNTHVWNDFQKVQVDVIRAHSIPQQWITTNLLDWWDNFDQYVIAKDLDFTCFDWYIGTGNHDYKMTATALDVTRGYKGRNFWIMETQPGSVNWSGINNMLDRHEAHCMAFQAVAHGSDALLYWQWRSAYGGQEQLHGCILGADGKPRPFFKEVIEVGEDFAKVSEAVDGTSVHNSVAIIHSFDSRWAINGQKHHKDFDPIDHMRHYHSALINNGIQADIVNVTAPLSSYKLVVMPSIWVLSNDQAKSFIEFVEAGGTLLITARTAQKNEENALHPSLQPGPLREIAGVEVQEYYALDKDIRVQAKWSGMLEGKARIWAELLNPLSDATEIVAKYGACNGWLDGGAAVTRHPVGGNGGSVIYCGAWLDADLQNALMSWVIEQAHIAPLVPNIPDGVEIAQRSSDTGKCVTFVMNHTPERQSLEISFLTNGAEELLSQTTTQSSEVKLEGYEVKVYLQQI